MEKVMTRTTVVTSVRMAGCGHIVYMDADQMAELRQTHKTYYCTICKYSNYFPGESDVEALERQLTTVKDQRDTARRSTRIVRDERDQVKRSLTAHKGHTTRIKKRIAAGVCPCCNRTFKNLARHMGNKHPDYKDA